jgi:hypothetical protein
MGIRDHGGWYKYTDSGGQVQYVSRTLVDGFQIA